MSDVQKDIIKTFGDNIILSGSSIIETKNVIIPVSPVLDILLNGGIPEGSFVILTGQPKCGKELAINEKVYTPNGPTTIGSIKTGDIICHPNGKTSKVIGVYPQGKKDIYEVRFNDGSVSRCGIDHNWSVSRNNRQTKYETLTLKQILDEGLDYSDRPRFKIPVTKPVYFNKKGYRPIPCYILGCLIGDGGLTQKTPRMSTTDKEIVNKFKAFVSNRGLFFKHVSGCDYAISGRSQGNVVVKNTLTRDLRKLGLMGKSSHNKFIPEAYKYMSVSQRFKLAQGLMDTDGHNRKGRGAEYTTVSHRLAMDVQELLEGLGYTVTIAERETELNNKKFVSFRLGIHGNDIDKLFSLPRKKSGKKRIKPDLFRAIVDVKKTSKEEAVCIEIDNEDGLFLTNNFIVTHNTTTSLDFAATAQNKKYGYGSFKDGREVYYLNIEGRLKKRDLQGIPHLNTDKFHIIGSQQGKILHAEEYLQIAEKLINEVPGSIVIIDSYSALCTEAEITSDMNKMQRADGAKLLAKFCRKVANVIPVNKNVVIGITHLMGNPTGYGAEFKEKSGQAVAYQTDIKLRAKKFSPWTIGSNTTPVGQEVEWQVVCSALGAPGASMTSFIRYGYGIDRHTEIVNLASDIGLIHKAGAWFTLTSLEDKPKFQGAEKVRQYLIEHPETYENLLFSIKETMGINNAG